MQSGRRDRHGFSLLEVTVALAIVLILAAVTVPSLISTVEFKQVTDTRDRLVELRNAVSNATTTGFFDKVAVYPRKLSELSQPIVANSAASYPNSCGNAFSAANVTSWNNSGPFIDTFIPTTGLVVPIGLVQNDMVRNPTTATAGTLSFRMLAVEKGLALELDYVIDGSDGLAAGSIRWVDPSVTGGAGYVDISYQMSVGNKC
jgi:prepilin-type N-terminal cleavage/methylation domain-containing protein